MFFWLKLLHSGYLYQVGNAQMNWWPKICIDKTLSNIYSVDKKKSSARPSFTVPSLAIKANLAFAAGNKL
jgi:hypothetical protein